MAGFHKVMDRHLTDEEIEAYRRRAVRACIDHEMALLWNKRLDEYGIERVSVGSWPERLNRMLGKPFRFLPTFTMGAE